MEALDIEKFDPNVSKLQEVVKTTKQIIVTDLTNQKQMQVVKEKRIELKGMRVAITKQGKEFREKAVNFQRAVIAKEKELISIIEPEEIRLKDIESEAEMIIERKKREVMLPERKKTYLDVTSGMKLPPDEELLDMDEVSFKEYLNEIVAKQNEKEQLEIEEKNRILIEKNEKLEREKEIREAEEIARKEEREKAIGERERLDREAKERIEIAESEAKERIAKEEREIQERKEKEKMAKLEEERIKKERQERLKKEEAYQEFLRKNGYSQKKKEDFLVVNEPNETKLFKLIGVFQHDK